ncbi:MAG: 1-acyl-sn-glycerol-3-phosphate acyltransferase [Rhodobacteraceae bacterium]|nr:1-acyl-sn-glycerol-3-phosphate acyltransferase [Paracoccaceae bacterium]
MRSAVLNISFVAFTLVMATCGILAAFLFGQAALRRLVQRWANGALWLTRRIMNAEFEIRGLERFKDGERPALLVSKHQSELDTFFPLALYPDLGAIAMLELERYPLIGPVIRKLDFILVSVEGAKSDQLRDVMTGAKRVYAEKRPILIYPEGELMRIGSRQRYKSGVFHIYQTLGCEATPVALSCGLVWPQRKWRKNARQRCVIEFMEPIPPGLDRRTFMAELETRIETRTMELIREHGSSEQIALAEERHRLGLTNNDAVPVSDKEQAHA